MEKKGDNATSRHVSGQSNEPLTKPAHALSSEDVLRELGSDPLNGLTASEAEIRRGRIGSNELGEAKGVQPIKIIIAQIANAMTLVPFSAPLFVPPLPDSFS